MPIVHFIILSDVGLGVASQDIFGYLFIIAFKILDEILYNVSLVCLEM